MKTNLSRLSIVFALVLLMGLASLTPASAQELPAGVDPTTEEGGNIEQLPAGVDDPTTQPTDEGTVTADSGQNQSQSDFLTGLAAGAVAGFIIGGVVVWYVRRN